MIAAATKHTTPAVIEPGHLYGLDEAKRRMRWSATAFRTARRNGLRVRYAGGRGYVRGSDLIEYIDAHGKDHK